MSPATSASPFAISGTTRLLGVMGWPVEHSLSPPMQNAALRAAALDLVYVALPVAPERLRDALRALPALGFLGVNVTVPHKESVAALVDTLGPSVAGIGAVNTVRVEPDGTLSGHNTDAEGFVGSVRAEGGIDPRGLSYFQAGAGGAGRAMAAGMLRAGVRRLVIANRTRERAEEIVAALRSQAQPGVELVACGLDAEATRLASEADIVANATSMGLKLGDASPLPSEAFRAGQLAYDTVYVRPDTPFVQAARQGGARTVTGLGMLAGQGALALELWTGHRADRALMLRVLEQEMARRQAR